MPTGDPARFTQADVDFACEQAILATEQDLLPFHGIDQVAFPRDRPQLPAAILYERDLLAFLHRLMWLTDEAIREVGDAQESRDDVERRRTDRVQAVQGANRLTTTVKRSGVKAWTAGDLQRAEQRLQEATSIHADRARLCAVLDSELTAVRHWLDQQLEVADEYKQRRASVRRDTQCIDTALSYSVAAFLEEDPAGRELWPGSGQIAGASYGDKWSWELPHRPWQTTTWSAFWLDNGEIYVLDRTGRGDFVRDPEHQILLLGRVPRPGTISRQDFLADVQRSAASERNSLMVLAGAVFDAQRATEVHADLHVADLHVADEADQPE